MDIRPNANIRRYTIGDFRFWYDHESRVQRSEHAHAGVELHFCEKGTGHFSAKKFDKEMSPGRVTLLFGPIPHIVNPNTDKQYRRTVLHIPEKVITKITDFLEINELGFLPSYHRPITQLRLSAKIQSRIKRHFKLIYRELKNSPDEINPGVSLSLAEMFYTMYKDNNKTITRFSTASPHDHLIVEQAMEIIRSDPYSNMSPGNLAISLGVSPGHLWKVFRRAVGENPREYLAKHRLSIAKELLLKGIPIKSIASMFNYTDTSSFSRFFKSQVGLTPREFILMNKHSS